MNSTRRQMLLQTLFGSGLVGLRSLATGIPVSFLLNPRKAFADAGVDAGYNPNKPQYLIFSTSGNGDPVNVNAPGTYNIPGVSSTNQPFHPSALPSAPSFGPVNMTLGATTCQAAAPWATLQPYNPAFFHHGTYTVVHPDEHNVLSLTGATKSGDMLVSLLASQLQGPLQTIQAAPLSIGCGGASETLTYGGAPQANLTPSSLRSTLASPGGPLQQLQAMRDADLNALNTWVKSEGTAGQKAFIDKYAISQGEARKISQALLNNLSSITGNSVAEQITAAITLIQMQVTPVIAIHVPFGGDNHSDPGFANEMAQTISGIASIVSLMQQLQAPSATFNNGAPLSESVSFAMLNVFGRNLIPPAGPPGRGHLGNHHCSVLLGPAFKPAVIGGIEPFAHDYRAQAINPSDGSGVAASADGGVPSGNIVFADTLASMALTLGHGLGVGPDFMNQNVLGATAKIVPAALVKEG